MSTSVESDVVKVAEEKAEAAISLFVKKNAEREHLGDAREDVLWWSLFDVMLAAVKEAEAARHQKRIEELEAELKRLREMEVKTKELRESVRSVEHHIIGRGVLSYLESERITAALANFEEKKPDE